MEIKMYKKYKIASYLARVSVFSMGLMIFIQPAKEGQAKEARTEAYPVVFSSPSELRKFGIAVTFEEKVQPFRNKCYVYGESSYRISISDEVLARFRKEGFSLEATCLGLVSQSRFDPETGRRLATYMIVYQDYDPSLVPGEPGFATEELPLELPKCFRNGTPYSDCVFRYGRESGKPLSREATVNYRLLGIAIANCLSRDLKSL
jgi:hypothetical protein